MNIPKSVTAALLFADGSIIYGHAIGAKTTAYGEICFNTAIAGYQETITDLSYAGQIITFTFPHIGNVGSNLEDMESKSPACRAIIVRENISSPSNFRNQADFNGWLIKHNIPGICDVDTRAITNYVRNKGPQNVAICCFNDISEFNKDEVLGELRKQPLLDGLELTKGVTSDKSSSWDQKIWKLNGGFSTQSNKIYKVVAIDYGAKLNILRCLSEVGFDVTVVPADFPADEIVKLNPDGVFLSNGPGDPAATFKFAGPILTSLINKNIPIFGICLGHQLLSLALGCRTVKMKRGHRGANQPVKDLLTGKVEITSQNHGFVVDENSLPSDVEITHISLFDGSIEGIKSKTKPIFCVQYHPEASPGPHDSFYLFERFAELIKLHNSKLGAISNA